MKRWAVVLMLTGCASLTVEPAGLAGTWRNAAGREIVIAPYDLHEPMSSCWKEKGAKIHYLWQCAKEGVPNYSVLTFATMERVCNVSVQGDVLTLKDCEEAGKYRRVQK